MNYYYMLISYFTDDRDKNGNKNYVNEQNIEKHLTS